MRSFLGLVNYLNRFSPHLAELSDLLRQICRKNEEFQLTETVRVAFSRTKEEISKNVTLPYFNPNSSTTLQTNASKKGLGAVLLQNSKPVMFASRALTGSERNYQNLERECLATIWGMEKFHYFLYGKEFTLETDQKPLVSIYRKHMVEISPRMQRFVRYHVPKFPHSSATFNIILGSCILASPKVLQGSLGNSACPMQCSQPRPVPANRNLTGLTWFPIVLNYIK